MKKIFRSKTIWASLGTIITSIGLIVTGEQELQEFFIGILGFVFLILRFKTNKGIE